MCAATAALRFPCPAARSLTVVALLSLFCRHTYHLASSELNLDYITDNPWLVVPTSALRNVNIDRVLPWLVAQASKLTPCPMVVENCTSMRRGRVKRVAGQKARIGSLRAEYRPVLPSSVERLARRVAMFMLALLTRTSAAASGKPRGAAASRKARDMAAGRKGARRGCERKAARRAASRMPNGATASISRVSRAEASASDRPS